MGETASDPTLVIEMAVTADGKVRPQHRPRGFVPNPNGRPPGPNRVTVEARAAASELINNPAYREALAQRLLDGTAGAMEALMWFYAHGRPKERTEDDATSAYKGVSNDELRQRLVDAMNRL